MRGVLFPVPLLLFTASIIAQIPPAPLHDGQQVTLTGRLTMEPAGRLQFVTVKTAEAYQPMVQGENRKEHPAGVTNELGLSGYNRYGLLYANRGRVVTVTGTLMTDSASPYYFHSASLKARSIRTANGTELIGSPAPEMTIAPDVKVYHAEVLLQPDLASPWRYGTRGAPTRDGARSLSCHSNGGGDVVNCFCEKGFHPTAGELAIQGRHDKARLFQDTAQFDVGDEKVHVLLSVTCSR